MIPILNYTAGWDIDYHNGGISLLFAAGQKQNFLPLAYADFLAIISTLQSGNTQYNPANNIIIKP